jgi:hypothetical protein
MGVRDGIDLCIQITQSPDITKEMFLEYVRGVVVPAVEANRDILECQAKPVTMFCDNFSCHCPDDVLQELPNHWILLITYLRHTSPIVRVLGMMLFGRLKSAK